MRLANLTPLAFLSAFAVSASAQVQLTELGTVNLDSTADSANAEYIGSNPSGIAWNGQDIYVCGFNGGGATGVGLVKVTDALGAATLGTSFGFIAGTPGSRGYSGLDVSGDKVAAAYDDGTSSVLGIQAFDLSGTQLWAATGRGGSGVGFDPGFPGGTPALGEGVGWATFGSGRRRLQDASNGATIYDGSTGMVIFTSEGTFFRDMDYDDSTGDIWLREGNNVIHGVRSGDNSLSGLTVPYNPDPDSDFVAGNNLAFCASNAGDFVIFGDRSDTALGQSFFDIVKAIAPDGTELTLDWGSFNPGTGAGYYDFSWDDSSKTLAVLDYSNRNAHIFEVSTPGPVTVDGSIAGDDYGDALAVQTVNTGFGDNQSEWNAAYGTIADGRLYLAATGNLQDNFNKLEIFIDSRAGGENTLSGVPGNDGAGNMAGLTFDAGFEADYHIIVRRGFFGTALFDVDIAVLGTADFSQHFNVFMDANEGSGTTGTGPGNASPIEVAYNGSNTGGVIDGDTAADQAAALAVETGLELSIDLADLGNPTGDIRVLIFQNNDGHNYASNQFLGGLAAPQGNLGGDGTGAFTGVCDFDLGNFAGDQFFTISNGPDGVGTPYCTAAANSTGSGASISASGSASIAANDLVLTAVDVPDGQFGIFYYGANQVQVTFGNGFRCVGGGNLGRLPVTTSVGGVLTTAVDNTNPPYTAVTLTAGSTWNFQAWFRDPAAGGAAFNLSNGLEIDFLP